MSIDLYGVRYRPGCRAVVMTAKQLNIKLNCKSSEDMPPINPANSDPTLDDKGFILWESRAIMQYLCNQYAPDSSLYPKDPKKRAVVDRYLNFDMSLSNATREALFSKMMTGVDPPEDKMNAYKNNLKLLDQLIGGNKYLTGNELTIADLALLATAPAHEMVQFDVSDYPNFKRWYSTLKSELPYFSEVNDFDKQEVMAYMEKMKAKRAAQK